LLRYPLVFLRWEHGIDPLTVLHAMAVDEPVLRARYPLLHAVLEPDGYLYDLSTSHAKLIEDGRTHDRWGALNEELARWACERFGVPRTQAWDAVCAAQAAVMPVMGRTYPFAIDLAYDVAQWYADGRTADVPRPLASFGPARLIVEDPIRLSSRPYVFQRATRLQWELASPLAHARAGELGGPAHNHGLAIVHPGVSLPWAVISAES
jgi:hypothetical protein